MNKHEVLNRYKNNNNNYDNDNASDYKKKENKKKKECRLREAVPKNSITSAAASNGKLSMSFVHSYFFFFFSYFRISQSFLLFST